MERIKLLNNIVSIYPDYYEYKKFKHKYIKSIGFNYINIWKYIANRIDYFVEFDNNYNSSSGIYMIEDFYIGKSKNIKERISNHIVEPFYSSLCINPWNYISQKDKAECILNILEYRKLKVTVLSPDISKEEYYIQIYNKKSNLFNVQFNKLCKNI